MIKSYRNAMVGKKTMLKNVEDYQKPAFVSFRNDDDLENYFNLSGYELF